MELLTACRVRIAFPAPSATRSSIAGTPSISSVIFGVSPKPKKAASTCILIALGLLGMTRGWVAISPISTNKSWGSSSKPGGLALT